jgi:mRNA interferase MazF
LTLNPVTNKKGRRSALVVSKDPFNRSTGLAIVCPITDTESGFPFHVAIPENSKLTGFIMVEQAKSVDFGTRRAKRIEHSGDELLFEVLSILDACIYYLANMPFYRTPNCRRRLTFSRSDKGKN